MQRLVFITGASSGIGMAVAQAAAADGAQVGSVSRRPGPGRHLAADLSDPASWPAVVEWMGTQITSSSPDWVGFVHCAATLTPIGFAGDVAPGLYVQNVLLNSASPQVLGAGFLRVASESGLPGALMQISSGAARSPYPGWSSYCAAKAAVDQWVRVVGQEEARAGRPMTVMSVAPGVVATDMQAQIRESSTDEFPEVARFHALKDEGVLADPIDVGRKLWRLLIDGSVESGAVLDLRNR